MPRVMATIASACCVATLAACGSNDSSSGSRGASDAGGGGETKVTGKVYYLIPGTQSVRYLTQDAPNLKAAFAQLAPGIQFETLNSNNDASRQLAQAETAIASNAKALIVSAADAKQAAGILIKASAAGVPVITYAPESDDGPAYAHVSVPFKQIGQDQGKYFAEHLPKPSGGGPVKLAKMYGDPGFAFYTQMVQGFDEQLKPLIASGKVKVVCKADAKGWVPAAAQRNMEQCLTKTNNKVDAALLMNDDLAGGAIAAIKQQNLMSKVRVFGGYDATVPGIQRVLLGQQEATMSPPYKAMARRAAQLTLAAIAKPDGPPPANLVNGTFDNGFKDPIPAAYIPNVFITADNVDKTVFTAGIYKRSQICKGQAAGAAACQGK